MVTRERIRVRGTVRTRQRRSLSWRQRIARVCWSLVLVLLFVATCGVL